MDKTHSTTQQEMVVIPMIEMGDTRNPLPRSEAALPLLPKENGSIEGLRYWNAYSMQEHARAAVAQREAQLTVAHELLVDAADTFDEMPHEDHEIADRIRLYLATHESGGAA